MNPINGIEMMRYTTIAAVLAILGTTAACSDNDPVEARPGSASAVITDDASSSGAFQSDEGSAYRSEGASTFSGSLNADAEVAISADGQTWIDLGSPTRVNVALQSSGDETAVHTNASVPATTYSRVRLTLSGGQANVDAGALLGGITFSSALAIRVGGSDNRVVIEKEVQPFTVTADAHARIIFDLNSEGWVDKENAEDETAEDEEVEDSATADREVSEPQPAG